RHAPHHRSLGRRGAGRLRLALPGVKLLDDLCFQLAHAFPRHTHGPSQRFPPPWGLAQEASLQYDGFAWRQQTSKGPQLLSLQGPQRLAHVGPLIQRLHDASGGIGLVRRPASARGMTGADTPSVRCRVHDIGKNPEHPGTWCRTYWLRESAEPEPLVGSRHHRPRLAVSQTPWPRIWLARNRVKPRARGYGGG